MSLQKKQNAARKTISMYPDTQNILKDLSIKYNMSESAIIKVAVEKLKISTVKTDKEV